MGCQCHRRQFNLLHKIGRRDHILSWMSLAACTIPTAQEMLGRNEMHRARGKREALHLVIEQKEQVYGRGLSGKVHL